MWTTESIIHDSSGSMVSSAPGRAPSTFPPSKSSAKLRNLGPLVNNDPVKDMFRAGLALLHEALLQAGMEPGPLKHPLMFVGSSCCGGFTVQDPLREDVRFRVRGAMTALSGPGPAEVTLTHRWTLVTPADQEANDFFVTETLLDYKVAKLVLSTPPSGPDLMPVPPTLSSSDIAALTATPAQASEFVARMVSFLAP